MSCFALYSKTSPRDIEAKPAHEAAYRQVEQIDASDFSRHGTADVVNDPRFYLRNVLDKRLASFEGVAIVTSIIAAEAVKQCFELPADFELVGPLYHVVIFAIIGFSFMICVLYLAFLATSVLSLQLFFIIRLMTAGPTGFDKAASFYKDTRMFEYRERAIFGVKWSIVLFFVSTGFMLYVKIYTEGAARHTVERDEEEGRPLHKVLSIACLFVFLVLGASLLILVRTHQRVFDECYFSRDLCLPRLSKKTSSKSSGDKRHISVLLQQEQW